ncbi:MULTISPECIES: hypothetical protein [Luteibacter]|uniref:hypothetical protein n=1 Tax=Luteibacter TaxID=242605 RepID=UPI00055F60BE|nr:MULTISPECIES: hypothetical protein [unclassified Luteibacter]MDR6642797.1 hypothetical protein [Luteibacter sp. 1214]
MRQVQITHPAGRFAVCRQGGHAPRHIEHHGRTLRETMQADVPAIRHSLECQCGRSTGLHATLTQAEADWGVLYGQIPMVLPAPIPFPPTARRRAAHKEKARG